jgi:hypothetical protein
MMRRRKWYVGKGLGKGALSRSSDPLITAAAPIQPFTRPPVTL